MIATCVCVELDIFACLSSLGVSRRGGVISRKNWKLEVPAKVITEALTVNAAGGRERVAR